ncbi:MAG: hypothetical protein HY552_05685 [Elusimicrobia bacterium]|nr:hypothetical protein [Elusimicrobiota bacterium]
MATLLVAFMTVPVMALLLSARLSMGRQSRQVAAAAAVRRLSEVLKAYVVADLSLAPGPGAGPEGWSLPGDRRGGYALADGVHELDPALWAVDLSSYSAVVRYQVTTVGTPAGPQSRVSFEVSWKEP